MGNSNWLHRWESALEEDFLEGLTATFEMASRDDSLDIRVMEDCVTRIKSFRSGDSQDITPVRPVRALKTLDHFRPTLERSATARRPWEIAVG